jgi:hypothetical protein
MIHMIQELFGQTLRAFGKIHDPQKRREIIELVESKAETSNEDPDDEQPSR